MATSPQDFRSGAALRRIYPPALDCTHQPVFDFHRANEIEGGAGTGHWIGYSSFICRGRYSWLLRLDERLRRPAFHQHVGNRALVDWIFCVLFWRPRRATFLVSALFLALDGSHTCASLEQNHRLLAARVGTLCQRAVLSFRHSSYAGWHRDLHTGAYA